MKTKYIYLFPFLFWLFGCSFSEDLKESDKIMESFFNERIKEGGTGSNEFYSKKFLEATTEQKWNNIKALVLKAHGKLVSYEQVSWQIKNQAHTSKLSGTFVFYEYKTIYEKGEGMEKITLFKNSEYPEFKIISHNYNSDRIQELINKSIEQAAQTDS